jgi:hypothetical protein
MLRISPFAIPLAAVLILAGCTPSRPTAEPPPPDSPAAVAFLDTLQQRTFRFFWELSDARTGLTPDRAPTKSFSSVAAVGFALTAYPIGAERGYITRAQARDRVLTTLRFFWNAPQGPAVAGVTGHKGFFYHFLDMETGHRFERVELSTIDTALLLGGVLFCQSYFDGTDAAEVEIRALADSLYRRVDWRSMQARAPLVSMGWTPEEGLHTYDWRGYDEAMILYVLALGSPTFPISEDAWRTWTTTYQWGSFHGSQPHVGFAPLFGHQYSHTWIDFRGIQDDYMRSRGIDYFENSRRAVLAQQRYAIENPNGWPEYGERLWGLSASDGPADVTLDVNGRSRQFFSYAARGASFTEVRDDGTIAPTAVGGSIAFAPEITIPTLMHMRERFGDHLFSTYGFLDAFNLAFPADTPTLHGAVVPNVGWIDGDYLGIDQGPILIMTENYRSGLVWKTMRKNPYIIAGLRRAGFRGGWLDEVRDASR